MLMSIDQSLSCSGYIIWDTTSSDPSVRSWGVIKTPSGTEVIERLRSVMVTLDDLITVHQVTDIVIESLPYGARSTSVRPLAALYYFIHNLCVDRGVTFSEANVSGVKKLATGKGNADKNSMIEYFALRDPELWSAVLSAGLKKSTGLADVADAYHIGVYHTTKEPFNGD